MNLFPSYVTAGSYAAGSGNITAAINRGSASSYPDGILFVVLMTKNNDVHTCATAGWTLVSQVNSGAGLTASLWKSRGGVVVNPTFNWPTSSAFCAQMFVFDAADGPMELAGITLGSSNNGITNAHGSPTINSSQPNSLFVYFDVCGANSSMGTPAGWTEIIDGGSAVGGSRIVMGTKQAAAPGTASGTIAVTGGTAAWVQWQIELYTEIAVNDQISKVETSAWLDHAPGVNVSKVETAAWLDSASGLNVSKVEHSAWLTSDNLVVSKVSVEAWLTPGIPPVDTARRRRNALVIY
jgi:hypothetical protein